METLVFLPLRLAVSHMREIVIIRVFYPLPSLFLLPSAPVEFAPFDRFSCFMVEKTCVRVIYVLFRMRTKNLIFSTIFHRRGDYPPSKF